MSLRKLCACCTMACLHCVFLVSACNNGVFGAQILSVPPCMSSCVASDLHALSALLRVCFWELKVCVCFACDAKRVFLVISVGLQGFPHSHTMQSSSPADALSHIECLDFGATIDVVVQLV